MTLETSFGSSRPLLAPRRDSLTFWGPDTTLLTGLPSHRALILANPLYTSRRSSFIEGRAIFSLSCPLQWTATTRLHIVQNVDALEHSSRVLLRTAAPLDRTCCESSRTYKVLSTHRLVHRPSGGSRQTSAAIQIRHGGSGTRSTLGLGCGPDRRNLPGWARGT